MIRHYTGGEKQAVVFIKCTQNDIRISDVNCKYHI